MGKVIATCISEIKGIQKKNVHQVKLIEDFGIEGDAHAGKWHRQVSLLSYDRIEEFRARGAKVEDGKLDAGSLTVKAMQRALNEGRF